MSRGCRNRDVSFPDAAWFTGAINFRQLLEPESTTYTYLPGDPGSGQALLIDPVIDTAERDLAMRCARER